MHSGIPEWGVWGSVRRAIRSEKGDGVSIVAYGADPEASWQANTAAIQEALADVDAGGTVVVPDGVFMASVRVETAGVRIVGPGTLKTPNSATDDDNECPLRIMADDVIVDGVGIDGNKSGNPQITTTEEAEKWDGIAIYASDVTVRNCYVRNTLGHGIIAWNGGFDTATAGARNNLLIEGNRVETGKFRALIDVASTLGSADTSERITIRGNFLTGTGAEDLENGITLHTANRVTIVGNHVRRTHLGISVHTNSSEVAVVGNTVFETRAAGLRVRNNASRVVVADNTFTDNDGNGHMVVLDTVSFVRVVNNLIEGVPSAGSNNGVQISNGCADIVVEGNDIADIGAGQGIIADGGTDRLAIRGNHLSSIGGGPIRDLSTSNTEVLIEGNHVHDVAARAIISQSARPVIRGNRVIDCNVGVQVQGDNAVIQDNVFETSGFCVELESSSGAVVMGNVLARDAAASTVDDGSATSPIIRNNILNGTFTAS